MKHVICAVLDTQLSAFMPPFSAAARGVAQRMFADAVNGDSPMGKHPEDYALYFLCEWDDSVGAFEVNGLPELMVRAKDLVNKGV